MRRRLIVAGVHCMWAIFALMVVGGVSGVSLGYEYVYSNNYEDAVYSPPGDNDMDSGSGPGYMYNWHYDQDGVAEMGTPGESITFECFATTSVGAAVKNLTYSKTASYNSYVDFREWWDWNGPPGSEPDIRFHIDYSWGWPTPPNSGVNTFVNGAGDLGGPGTDGCLYTETNASAHMGFTWWSGAGTQYDMTDNDVSMSARSLGGGYLTNQPTAWSEAYLDPELDGDVVYVPDPWIGSWTFGTEAFSAEARVAIDDNGHGDSFLTGSRPHKLEVRRGVDCSALSAVWVTSTQSNTASARTVSEQTGAAHLDTWVDVEQW